MADCPPYQGLPGELLGRSGELTGVTEEGDRLHSHSVVDPCRLALLAADNSIPKNLHCPPTIASRCFAQTPGPMKNSSFPVFAAPCPRA